MVKTQREYDYTDEQGELLYQAVRKEPKDFRQRRPDGQGGWIWNLQEVRRVLYHLPELVTADPQRAVFVVEGEKDVETLRSFGFLATCNPGGAGKWRSEYSEILRGRRVAILPDNDASGLKHAYEVAKFLQGSAGQIRVIQLPDLPSKGDVTDWFANGGSADELKMIFKGTAPWDGTDPALVTGSEILEPEQSKQGGEHVARYVVDTIGGGDADLTKECNRILDGVQQIIERSHDSVTKRGNLSGADPLAFIYMARGIMQDLVNGEDFAGRS